MVELSAVGAYARKKKLSSARELLDFEIKLFMPQMLLLIARWQTAAFSSNRD